MKSLRIEVSYTTREYHSLNLYFSDLSRIDLLDEQEEVILCKKVREGDMSALDRLVRGNLRFVVSCAKKYEQNGLPLGDLISEGNLGLITAAKKFDETLGFKFITYAVFWIRQAILLALGEHSRMMRLPMNQVRNITVAQQQMGILEQQLERTATMDELAEAVGIPVGQMAEQLQLDRQPLSLYQPQGYEAGQRELVDLVADDGLLPSDHLVLGSDKQLFIGSLLSALTARERGIIEGLYGINCPLESSYQSIADQWLLTPARIKQIEEVAIRKLKTLVKGKRNAYG